MFVRKSTYMAKVRECEDLRAQVNQLHREALGFNNQNQQTIYEMADAIRNQDQLIYQMSQCTSWEPMRPIFNRLQIDQERRMKAESSRITDILRRELISVYKNPPEALEYELDLHKMENKS
jgi:hypothetical protein